MKNINGVLFPDGYDGVVTTMSDGKLCIRVFHEEKDFCSIVDPLTPDGNPWEITFGGHRKKIDIDMVSCAKLPEEWQGCM